MADAVYLGAGTVSAEGGGNDGVPDGGNRVHRSGSHRGGEDAGRARI